MWLHGAGSSGGAASWPGHRRTRTRPPRPPLPPGPVPCGIRTRSSGRFSVRSHRERRSRRTSQARRRPRGQAGLVLRNVALTEQLRTGWRSSCFAATAGRGPGRGTPQARAKHPRRRAAAARRARREAAARRVDHRQDDERASAMLARAPGETNVGARRPPGPGARHLPAAACRPGARRRAGGAGPEGRVAGDGRRRRNRQVRQDVEATVYFCSSKRCRTSPSTRMRPGREVRLSNGHGELRFEVVDDGTVSIRIHRLRDRPAGHGGPTAAVGGSADVRSAPGAGTRSPGSALQSARAASMTPGTARWVPRRARLAA